MLPIPPSFLQRLSRLTEGERARYADALPDHGTDLAEDDAFAIYVAAHAFIDANGWRTADSDGVVEKLLANWHTDEVAKLLDQAVLYTLCVEHGRSEVAMQLMAADPFRAVVSFGPVLAHVPFSMGQMHALLSQLRTKVVGDGAQGVVNRVLRSWATQHSQQSWEYLAAHFELHPSLALPLAQGVLDADAQHGGLLAMLEESFESEGGTRQLALAMLPSLRGHGILPDADVFSRISASIANSDVGIADAGLLALGQFLQEEATGDAIALLRRAVPDSRQEIQWRVSHIIWASEDSKVKQLAPAFLESVADLDVSRVGVIRNIDYLLSDLVEKDFATARAFLAAWVMSHPQEDPRDLTSQSRFAGTMRALTAQRDHIAATGTEWMAQEARLARAGAFLFDHFRIDRFQLDALQSADEDLVECLVDRTLAFHMDPTRKFNLLCSLAPTCQSIDQTGLLQEAFRELCLNYPGAAERWLAETSFNDEHLRGIGDAVSSVLATYFAPTESSEALMEFLPPPPRMQEYARHQQRQQTEIYEALGTSGEFILSQIAHTVNVGRGDAWVMASRDGCQPSSPSTFSESSFSLELPRLEILDPDGEAFKRVVRINRLRRKRETGS